MTTTATVLASSLVPSAVPTSALIPGQEPLEALGTFTDYTTILGEVKHALSHIALPTASNTTPLAGFVGELIRTTKLVAATVSLTTATELDVAEVVLSPGDWTISGSASFVLDAATVTSLQAGSSDTSVTLGLDDATASQVLALTTKTGTITFPIPTVNVRLATETTYYLVAKGAFSAGAITVHGQIQARRAS